MRKTSTLKSLTAVAALAAATLAPAAWAGHLNIVLEASLDGREQVSADATNREMIGDPDGRATAYVFGIDNDPLTLCYALVDIKRIAELAMPPGGGRAAHIHEGARGTNGPVIANLAWPQGGQAGDCLTEGEAGKFNGGPLSLRCSRRGNSPSVSLGTA